VPIVVELLTLMEISHGFPQSLFKITMTAFLQILTYIQSVMSFPTTNTALETESLNNLRVSQIIERNFVGIVVQVLGFCFSLHCGGNWSSIAGIMSMLWAGQSWVQVLV
jgi:hypothetical protein